MSPPTQSFISYWNQAGVRRDQKHINDTELRTSLVAPGYRLRGGFLIISLDYRQPERLSK